jgi:hypothetical protein
MCIAHKHKRCRQINYHTPIIDLLAFRRVGPFPAAKCDKHSCCLIKTLNLKFTHIEAIWSNTHIYVSKMIPNCLWKFNQNHFQLVILWFTTYHLEVFQLVISPWSDWSLVLLLSLIMHERHDFSHSQFSWGMVMSSNQLEHTLVTVISLGTHAPWLSMVTFTL